MTKLELVKALERYTDDEEIAFISCGIDRDGWPIECVESIIYVESVKEHTEKENRKYAEQVHRRIEREQDYITELKAKMATDNKPTKAAAKRNAERRNSIEWSEKRIRMDIEWLANH